MSPAKAIRLAQLDQRARDRHVLSQVCTRGQFLRSFLIGDIGQSPGWPTPVPFLTRWVVD